MKTWQILALALLPLLGMANDWRLIEQYRHPAELAADPVAAEEEKFQELRGFLPPDASVGYIGKKHAPGTDGVRNFRMIQYFLAPVVVFNDTSRELIVTYLAEGEEPPAGLSEQDWTLVRDFGRNVKLYRRRAQ
ncbi:MAG TPA: hypothetical protein VJR29_10855 [bacterium]|nr:hypothetical protein [bacterium]